MAVTIELKQQIKRAYVTPGHPVCYSAPARVASHFNIKEREAKEILEEIEGYTLHREFKKPRKYNPYYTHGRREQVQADLIDVGQMQNDNEGTRFLLLLIDIFTKYIWVYPLKNKSAVEMETTLRQWVEQDVGIRPEKLLTDQGTEFTNGRVQRLLRESNIEWQPALGTMKAAVAERANKTFQILLYKHLTENETLKYMDVLQDLVKTYNTRGHRTLKGMTPSQADQIENEDDVQQIFHQRYEELGRNRARKLPFKVGDIVRVKSDPKKISSSSRAYAEQFTGPYFRIMRINRQMAVPMYYLRDFDTDEIVKGGFYKEELQLQRGDVYRIEAVLDRRVRRGRREILVKWKWFGPRWNEWIPEGAVRRVF